MAQRFGLPREKFWRMYGQLRAPYDRGVIGADDYWRSMAQCAGVILDAKELPELNARDLAMWSDYDGSMLALAAELRQAGIRTGILSNMLADMLAKLRAEVDWLALFDVQVYSCEVGLVKPEAAIYTRLLEELGVEAERTLFLDDNAANVEAARRAGLQALVFTSERQVREYLAASLPPSRQN